MKKVGILSMQRIQNYGSFLQAYGLKNILQDIGCEVQFVDYHPGDTLIPADGGKGLGRKISKVMEVFKYSAPLKEKIRFINYKKNYATNYYPYLGIDDKKNYSPELDVLVIGSDEVFNCVQNNTNVGFSPELFGQNNNAKKLISYAASFGNTTIDKLEKCNVKDTVAKWLNDFDTISVRDENSGEIVKSLTGKNPMYNLDPVLMYDFIGKCKSIPNSVPEDKYMLLYGYSGRFSKDECKIIRKYAKAKGLKVFCIGGVQDCCDKFIDVNPFEVIAYFQHADCVVTDTFHGTIMSVITHRQFAAVVRKSGYGNSQKLTDLLSRLDLGNRIVPSINEIDKIIDTEIDYDVIDKIVEKQREITYTFLQKEMNTVV
ncbi:MAG: polysaccharide pyruvyl transferase family protein [Butyrivibrio sp.]|nr:polysaccharide pyruvyl transferase family protein [Butyrivibrio sp.]